MHQNVITTQCILVKLITKSNSSLTKKESRVLLRQILKFHSEILQGKNRLRPSQLFKIDFSPKPVVIARPFYFTVSAVCRNKTTNQGCPFGNIPIFIGKVTDPTNSAI